MVLITEYRARVKLYSKCLCSWLLLYLNITSIVYVDIKILHVMKKGYYVKGKTLCYFINCSIEVILSHLSLTFWWLWIYLELHIMCVTCHLYQLIWIFCLMCFLKCSSASELTQSVTNSEVFVFMDFEDVCGKFDAALLTDKKELRCSVFRCYHINAVMCFLHYFTERIF